MFTMGITGPGARVGGGVGGGTANVGYMSALEADNTVTLSSDA